MQTSASCYVKAGRLCIVGVCDTKDGPIPFSHVTLVSDVGDGPVDFGSELPEPLAVAIEDSKDDIKDQIVKGKIRLTVAQLVDRSRAGDQNAMSLLIGVRRKAKTNPRANYAFRCFREYVSKRPAGKIDFGEETALPAPFNLSSLVARASCIPIISLAVALADSPYTVDDCLRAARTCTGPRAVKRFAEAVKQAMALRKARGGDFNYWASDIEF